MYYYSIQPSEMDNLSVDEVTSMDETINIIRAQEILTELQVASYPYFKKQDREQLHKFYHRTAYPDIWSQEKNKVTLKELAKILAVTNG